MTLSDVLGAAAAGHPPEPDGSVAVLPQQGLAAAVVAFSAHFLVCADVDLDWVNEVLPAGDYSAPHGARFLTTLADRIGSDIGALDVVLVRQADDASGPGLDLEEIDTRDHPRVVRALRYREDVRVSRTPDHAGHLLVGRGRAGRWEMAFEVEPGARGAGRRARAAPCRRSRPAGAGGRARLGPGLARAPGVAARRAGRGLPAGLRRGAVAVASPRGRYSRSNRSRMSACTSRPSASSLTLTAWKRRSMDVAAPSNLASR